MITSIWNLDIIVNLLSAELMKLEFDIVNNMKMAAFVLWIIILVLILVK